MTLSKLELLIEFGNKSDENTIKNTIDQLKTTHGVKEAQFKDGAIYVETSLPSSVVVDLVSDLSGRRTVLQGFGDTQSAVAMVSDQSCSKTNVMGVIRFQQTSEGPLVVDGTVDGLRPGEHSLCVHETGDLSEGCKSIGNVYSPTNVKLKDQATPAGDLGIISADDSGRSTFRIVNDVLKVWDLIGRSVAVREPSNRITAKGNGDYWTSIACGIIARSAGVFENPKRVCACDGVVVWDERERPLAGKGRRVPSREGAKETGDGCAKSGGDKCCCK